jgi:hypothetical protein
MGGIMFCSLGELGIEIELGCNAPGTILQRNDGGLWYFYLIDGEPVVNPFDMKTLPPGFYRLVDSPISTASD